MNMNICLIIMTCALAITVIFDLIEGSKRRERKKKIMQEKREWGRIMYTKGYKDCKSGKDFNPFQTAESIKRSTIMDEL